MPFFDYPGGSASVGDQPAFLSGASSSDWETILRYVGAEPFVAQQILLEAGDPGDTFCILAEGRVQVQPPASKRVVATIEAGSIFGEIAFLDGGTRTATIRALTNGTMIRVTREGFAKLQAREPQLAQRIALDLGRICAARLRKMLTMIGR